MSYVMKFFMLGLGSVGMMLATASDSEAGCRHRHRHRHHGHCGSYSAPFSTGCCNTGYAAPVSNGCCNTVMLLQSRMAVATLAVTATKFKAVMATATPSLATDGTNWFVVAERYASCEPTSCSSATSRAVTHLLH